ISRLAARASSMISLSSRERKPRHQSSSGIAASAAAGLRGPALYAGGILNPGSGLSPANKQPPSGNVTQILCSIVQNGCPQTFVPASFVFPPQCIQKEPSNPGRRAIRLLKYCNNVCL